MGILPLVVCVFAIITGYCYEGCEHGYHGDLCDQNCPSRCYRCNSTTNCIACKDGYYGRVFELDCPEHCAANRCYMNTGQCSNGCNTGYAGATCEHCAIGYYTSDSLCRICPRQCVLCSSDINCNTCKRGYYGANCANACSPGCPNHICYTSDGRCISTVCHTGFQGDKCDQCMTGWFKIQTSCFQCQTNCVSCISQFSCTACKVGYYGQICQHPCPLGCKDDQCANTDGNCECKAGFTGQKCSECVNGTFGSNCNQNCPPTCVSCSDNNSCVVCKTGYYGSLCELKCSTECDGACDKKSGKCSDCKKGRWGLVCQLDCNSTCSGQKCHYMSGKCLDGCVKDLFGEWCESRCSDNCIVNDGYSRCYNSNGACIIGCNNGYFGQNCQKKCGANCINSICSRGTGECILGCIGGFEGKNCTKAIEQSGTVEPTVVLAVSLAGGVVLFIVAVVVAVIVFCVRRWRTRHRNENNPPKIDDNVQPELRTSSHGSIQAEPLYHTYECMDTEESRPNNSHIIRVEHQNIDCSSVLDYEVPQSSDPGNILVLDYEEPQTNTYEGLQTERTDHHYGSIETGESTANKYEDLQTERTDHPYGSIETGESRDNTYQGLQMELRGSDAPYSELENPSSTYNSKSS